uniref:ABC transporter permease n=1 Tax=uncultured Ilumatobacter sp. TaxID=879968 RepID=UPI00374F1CA3
MSIRTALGQRNLLYLLSQKELRTRYRKSILGWAWSLLNPLSQMIIFSIIFLKVFDGNAPRGAASGLDNFPLYFLSGLLPFQFFSISVTAAIGNVQGGASLIKKVAFPHEHLVFSIVIAQLVTIGIELVVLSISFLFFGY